MSLKEPYQTHLKKQHLVGSGPTQIAILIHKCIRGMVSGSVSDFAEEWGLEVVQNQDELICLSSGQVWLTFGLYRQIWLPSHTKRAKNLASDRSKQMGQMCKKWGEWK